LDKNIDLSLINYKRIYREKEREREKETDRQTGYKPLQIKEHNKFLSHLINRCL